MQSVESLRQILGSAWRGRVVQPKVAVPPALHVAAGLETRVQGEGYDWEGLKRSGDPNHPYVLFQYTLAGKGRYDDRSGRYALTPPQGFITLIPSAHRYHLPADSARWTFFWLILTHPYVAQRVIERRRTSPAVLRIEPQSVLMAKAVHLFRGVVGESFRDLFDRESAILEFMLEYDRHAYQIAHPQHERRPLLEEVRAYVLENLRRRINVEELAGRRGMSRSHFTHHFRASTGTSPAQFITEVRLDEVRRQLMMSDDKLHAIAVRTGFADANHLCKVFRRHYHLTPMEFRRQMR